MASPTLLSSVMPTLHLVTLGGQTMGTTWSVKCCVPAHYDLHRLHACIQQPLDEVVAQMSTWEANSHLSLYNQAAADSWQVLPDEFLQVLLCALDIAKASEGAFDPTIAPLVQLWGFGANAAPQQVPDNQQQRLGQKALGWQHLQLQGNRLYQPGGLRLDFSAIAKGFGVDQVVASLQAQGVASALVEVGGELYGYGKKPDGQAWQVLVEHSPDEHCLDACVLSLDNQAIATSGDYWHCFEQNQQCYSHTIDPFTGAPITHAAAAVSVVATTAMLADAWATALTVMGLDKGLVFADKHHLAARFVVRGKQGVEAHLSRQFKTLLSL